MPKTAAGSRPFPSMPQEEEDIDQIINWNEYPNELQLDSMSCFMRDVWRQSNVLSPDEFLVRFAEFKAGNVAARDILIVSNVRLVLSIARKYLNRGMEMGDLIQMGMLGVVRALDKFDLSRNLKFSTYATYWIREHIERALLKQTRTIDVPVYVLRKVAKVNRALSHYEQQTQDTAAGSVEHQCCEELNMNRETFDQMRALLSAPLHIDEGSESNDESDYDYSGMHILDSLESMESEENPETRYLEQERLAMLNQALAQLPPQDANLLRKRYGLGDMEPTPLKELGQEAGISAEAIRQQQVQALKALTRLLLPHSGQHSASGIPNDLPPEEMVTPALLPIRPRLAEAA